jgi:hypothetical protein
MKLNRKNKWLIGGFCLTLYICYAFAFKGTLQYYKQYTEAKNMLTANTNQQAIVQQLAMKEKQLDGLLAQYNISDEGSFQSRLLDNLVRYCEGYHLKITDFQEPHIFIKDGEVTKSYIFSVQGSFNEILLLLNKIENHGAFGHVEHVAFEKKKDYRTNTYYLVCQVILQTIQANK